LRSENPKYQNLILFDGICNFCNFWVNWLINKDEKRLFNFSNLDSKISRQIFEFNKIDSKNIDSIVYIKNGEILTKSKAVLTIGMQLNGFIKYLCKVFYAFGFFKIYDAIYDLIAKFRYSVFGIKKQCKIPNKETLARFI